MWDKPQVLNSIANLLFALAVVMLLYATIFEVPISRPTMRFLSSLILFIDLSIICCPAATVCTSGCSLF